jgi:hypothetical protein
MSQTMHNKLVTPAEIQWEQAQLFFLQAHKPPSFMGIRPRMV